jgi:hypothetical protein
MEFAIDRAFLAAGLEALGQQIANAVIGERDPASLALTFRGKPVVGTSVTGIFADFGAKALGAFNEVIVALAAPSDAPLADKAPIRNRDQNQLLITATALGSFGFVLQEHREGELRLDDETPTLRAMRQAHAMLAGVLGTDDELADAAAELPARAMDRLRDFLKTMEDAQACCAVRLDGKEARFDSPTAVVQVIARIFRDNLRVGQDELVGAFEGVLPQAPAFEFKLAGDGAVIRGRISPAVLDIAQLNRRIGEELTIRVAQTQVGGGRAGFGIWGVVQAGSDHVATVGR